MHAIRDSIEDRGEVPTIRELARAVGLSSTGWHEQQAALHLGHALP
ncbi:LexA family protein [Streptomyces litchfieldiae]